MKIPGITFEKFMDFPFGPFSKCTYVFVCSFSQSALCLVATRLNVSCRDRSGIFRHLNINHNSKFAAADEGRTTPSTTHFLERINLGSRNLGQVLDLNENS